MPGLFKTRNFLSSSKNAHGPLQQLHDDDEDTLYDTKTIVSSPGTNRDSLTVVSHSESSESDDFSTGGNLKELKSMSSHGGSTTLKSMKKSFTKAVKKRTMMGVNKNSSNSNITNNNALKNKPQTPQETLDQLVESRGYSAKRFESLQTAYYRGKPTPIQEASYNDHMLDLVETNNVERLRELLQAGVSPNPVSPNGTSFLNLVCKRNRLEMLSVLLQYGASVQVADNAGCTPLHELCAITTTNADTMHMVQLILERDVRMLFLQDALGMTPLMLVPRQSHAVWINFLNENAHRYWIPRYVDLDGHQADPPLTKCAAAQPLPDPTNALTPNIVSMLCASKLSVKEALKLHNYQDQQRSNSSNLGSFFSSNKSTTKLPSDAMTISDEFTMAELEDMKALIAGKEVSWSSNRKSRKAANAA